MVHLDRNLLLRLHIFGNLPPASIRKVEAVLDYASTRSCTIDKILKMKTGEIMLGMTLVFTPSGCTSYIPACSIKPGQCYGRQNLRSSMWIGEEFRDILLQLQIVQSTGQFLLSPVTWLLRSAERQHLLPNRY